MDYPSEDRTPLKNRPNPAGAGRADAEIDTIIDDALFHSPQPQNIQTPEPPQPLGQPKPVLPPEADAAVTEGSFPSVQPDAKPELKSEPPKKKKKLFWILGAAVLLLALAAGGFFLFVHSYTDASCTEPGVCKYCGKEAQPALGHSYRPATCVSASVCARCGEVQGAALGHDFLSATCTSPETCSRCGETREPALGHRPGAATCTEAAVCSVCGARVGEPLGHDWLEATYDSPATCQRCGLEDGDPLGYLRYVLWTEDTEESVTLMGTNSHHPDKLIPQLYRCFRLSLSYRMTSYTGNPFGTWYVYGKDENGSWKRLGSFSWTAADFDTWITVELELDEPVSIQSLTITRSSATYSLNYSWYVNYAQMRVD